MQMCYRDQFRKIMHYESFDRMPVLHWNLWPETRARWIDEGLPPGEDEAEFLDAKKKWVRVRIDLELYPPLIEEVLEETREFRIFRNRDGVVQKSRRDRSSVPQYLDHALKDARQWPAFKKRLAPDPGRIPHDLDARIAEAEQSGCPVAVTCASLMGWIRNWMGVENMSYLMHDDPEVYADMVRTLAELTCWGLDQVVPRMKSPPDLAVGWEDICGSTGPLINPTFFEKHVAPGYRMIRRRLDHHGIDFYAVDCDGLIEPLLKGWLAAGVNLHYPVEIGAFGADPLALRRKFGKELRMIGGFDKRALELDRAAIDREIARRVPLMEEGGYIVLPDHHITPDTPLENYQYYLDRIRSLRFA